MIRVAWKAFITLGFILFLVFSGCRERQPSLEERLEQADNLLNSGQIDGAIVLLERGLEQDGNRVDMLERLAFAYAANGDPMLAAMTFMRIAELVPEQPEYLIYAAESLLEAGDTDGAAQPYRQYLTVRPNDRAVWVTLAQMLRDAGRLGESIEAYLAAERIEARGEQEIDIAQLYLQSQNLAQAQAWYARALDKDNEFRDDALLGLLETAIRAKRFAEAEALLKQLDAEYPGTVDQSSLAGVRNQLAEWSRRREAAKEALAALQERQDTLAADPVLEESASDPATQPASDIEEPEPVIVPSEEPVALARPTQPPVAGEVPAVLQPAQELPLSTLGKARQLRDAGQSQEAIRAYKQALVENDNQPQVWAELSELYLQTGQDRWAQATAKEAMRRDPENAAITLQFLRCAQRTMDVRKLVREMENAYRQFPDNPEVILVLGRFFADQGNTRNARILYERFMEVAPPNHPQRTGVQMELDFLGN